MFQFNVRIKGEVSLTTGDGISTLNETELPDKVSFSPMRGQHVVLQYEKAVDESGQKVYRIPAQIAIYRSEAFDVYGLDIIDNKLGIVCITNIHELNMWEGCEFPSATLSYLDIVIDKVKATNDKVLQYIALNNLLTEDGLVPTNPHIEELSSLAMYAFMTANMHIPECFYKHYSDSFTNNCRSLREIAIKHNACVKLMQINLARIAGERIMRIPNTPEMPRLKR